MRGSQRIILISVSICHLWFSICSIFKSTITVTNYEAPHLMKSALYLAKCIPGAIYPLLMHYLSIDRMLEIYFTFKISTLCDEKSYIRYCHNSMVD